jgi:ubiquinone/menaquinone biosynthesis C-methylase UbiE
MNLDSTQRAAQAQFARQSANYGRSHILAQLEDVEAALPELSLPARAKVLDVATGGGHTGLRFARLGHDVTLSDLTPAMLENAARAAAEAGLTVTTRLHPAEVMPYPDGTFDLVTCRIAPHHFTSPAEFVRETARVLKPGGRFLLIDGTVEDDQPEAEAWAHAVEKLRDPSHNRLLTPRAWRSLCEAAGLRVELAAVTPFQQPDLNWYFDVAATSEANRRDVLQLVETAPESARRLFRIGKEDGKIIWWWQRLTLVAAKPGPISA